MSERIKDKLIEIVAWIGALAFYGGVLYMLFGCSPKVVTVPEVHEYHHTHTDSVRQVDSIISERTTVIREIDSTTMAQYGITLRNAERAWLVLQNDMERRTKDMMQRTKDTVIIRDSVPVPCPEERKLTKWEQVKMDFGELIIEISCIFIIIGMFCLYLARRKV